MNQTLHERIQRRKKEAREKEIAEKAEKILHWFGTSSERSGTALNANLISEGSYQDNTEQCKERFLSYHGKTLDIEMVSSVIYGNDGERFFSDRIKIFAKEFSRRYLIFKVPRMSSVFEYFSSEHYELHSSSKGVHSDIDSYIPGKWENELDILYNSAHLRSDECKRVRIEREELIQKGQEEALRRKWGL